MKKFIKYGYYLIVLLLLFIFKNPISYAFKNINSFFQKDSKNNVQLELLKAENKSLKQELKNIKNFNKDNYDKFNYVDCKIIERNIYDFYDYIIIDKGSENDIKKDSAVISEKGLIGIVEKVYKLNSKVKLITSEDINISIKINDTYGVIDNYNRDKNYYEATVTKDSNIKINDEIYTSGLGIIPSNIYIGYVTKIIKSNIKDKIYFKTKNNINELNNLIVIKGSKNV